MLNKILNAFIGICIVHIFATIMAQIYIYSTNPSYYIAQSAMVFRNAN